ncbi:DUF2205 domain-containing protein [Rhizoctonia solani AG-1 IA]|uniref:DUF2205 domain-containing protein n=1 Tax=Thanatephorus cucumeris (strain AG1-IA) TaxID=983506 RepID=L8WR83_THACA|nr:DUF2205 domain-containing protein [Rhizoctonia solani AG-1 IA]
MMRKRMCPPDGELLLRNQIHRVIDIVAAQDDLRTLLGRVQTVQAEVDKLSSGNAMLQMYIDNLTKQIAKR